MRAPGLLCGRFLAAVVVMLAAACTSQPQPKSTSFVIAPATSEFYKYGPAQAFGPDLNLKRGDPVTLLRREYGYSQIRLADGTPGYVATEDLKAAPPPPMPARARASTRRVASRSSNVQPVHSDPLFDINDVPSPPLPTDPEKPKLPTPRAPVLKPR